MFVLVTGLVGFMRPWYVYEPGPSVEGRGRGHESVEESKGLHLCLGLDLRSEFWRIFHF